MKKVLLLAPMSSVHERFNIANINALKASKCEIHIAANFETGDIETLEHNRIYKEKLQNEGIVTHRIPFERGSLIKNIQAIRCCRRLFKKENFDMIHCHTETGGLITSLAMSKRLKAKFFYTPHGMSFYKGSSLKSRMVYRPIEKWICGKMDANLAINQEEFAVLSKWNSTTAKFIHGIGLNLQTIINARVDKAEKRAEFGIPEDAFLILSIGELNSNKNHQTIIQAISEIDNPNIYYLICGEGPLKNKLEDVCCSLHISDKVIFAGYRRDIPEILKIADVFTFPSYHEGLPVSMMEAMAAGLPVVCSDIRGNIDLIEDRMGGLLCSADDVNGFKEAVLKLHNDSDLRRRCGQINSLAIDEFTIEKVQKELEAVYLIALEE